ncbi:hypothetical protein [Methanohalobium evestigatum]|nr:hypothetical protein [Methanohalobium evestigatum]
MISDLKPLSFLYCGCMISNLSSLYPRSRERPNACLDNLTALPR